ncbi:MAG TPA: hypothetical protein DFK12_08210 [Gallionellaceae bacterium]|nr:hypothetical protein [Gallionellaceae bacterium]
MDKIIKRLDLIFSVRDIMTPTETMKRASSIEEASALFNEYDVVPFPKTGKIKGFFQCNLDEPCDLKPDHLISDTTGLLNMPRLLAENSFRFVISADKISGYVHYSDLNKPAMKVPLFVLIQAKEKQLWNRVQKEITENVVSKVFSSRAKKLIQKRDKAKKGNVDIGWEGVFTLPDILRLANHFQTTNIPNDQIELLRSTRNDISHSDKNLIGKHRDISRLVEALNLCQSQPPSRSKQPM